jgi:hypothetical protein
MLRGSQVGPGAAWAWHWAHKGVHNQLDRVLRHGALPVDPLGPLGYEAAWVAACDLTHIRLQFSENHYDYAVGDHSYGQQRSARPSAARWLTGTHGGMSFEVGMRHPITDVVYGWLAQDLKRIGLIGGLAWSRSDNAVPPFDM